MGIRWISFRPGRWGLSAFGCARFPDGCKTWKGELCVAAELVDTALYAVDHFADFE